MSRKSKKKSERLSEILQIPVQPSMKDQIEKIATDDDRTVVQTGRKLWREAIDARKSQSAESEGQSA